MPIALPDQCKISYGPDPVGLVCLGTFVAYYVCVLVALYLRLCVVLARFRFDLYIYMAMLFRLNL